MVDLDLDYILEADDLFYRHNQSPYVGRVMRGRIVRTLVRGSVVFDGGMKVSGVTGRLVRPGD